MLLLVVGNDKFLVQLISPDNVVCRGVFNFHLMVFAQRCNPITDAKGCSEISNLQ